MITPFELELGLDARAWGSSYVTNLAELDVSGDEEQMRRLIEQVVLHRPENPIDSDSDSDHDTSAAQSSTQQQQQQQQLLTSQAITVTRQDHSSSSSSGGGGGGERESRVAKRFDSLAGDFLSQRDYQGLLPQTEVRADTALRMGQFGVASTYRLHDA